MNKNMTSWFSRVFKLNRLAGKNSLYNSMRYNFSSSQKSQVITHTFPYGQAGQFIFDLRNRTYSLSFETIWQDHAQLSYQGLTGQKSFFMTEKGKQVNVDDLDLQPKQNEYIKMRCKIPEDYTIRGKINGSIHHIKNNVSSKTRSNSFQIQLLGYKSIYQWLNMQCQQMKLINKNGQVQFSNLTVKNASIDCQVFKSKKVMLSGEINLKATNKMDVRSIVAYQDALTRIQDSGDVYIDTLSGKLSTKNCKSLKIDRLLSCEDGIQIECNKIHEHIIIQTGSGTIQCLREKRQVLQQRIKLGKMHKGKIDFDIHENHNSPYSKVLVQL